MDTKGLIYLNIVALTPSLALRLKEIGQGCQTQILSRANYALGFGLEGHKFLELKRFNTTQCSNFCKCKLAHRTDCQQGISSDGLVSL